VKHGCLVLCFGLCGSLGVGSELCEREKGKMASITASYGALLEKALKEYDRSGAAGKVIIQVGSATCEITAGADRVKAEFTKLIAASGRDDILLKQVGVSSYIFLTQLEHIIETDEKGVVVVFESLGVPVDYLLQQRQLLFDLFKCFFRIILNSKAKLFTQIIFRYFCFGTYS